jgi:AcrR family transcriptional regulator
MAAPETGARTRILDAAYDLFSRRGIRGVGIDAVIAQSGVSRMTLNRHFRSKQELVLAYLQCREERWTRAWMQAEVQQRAAGPQERLLAIFDVFDGWFHETADDHDNVYKASIAYLAGIRDFLEELARGAGVGDPDDFARKWHILMKGSIVAAGEGDPEAAKRAQQIGRLLLAHELAGAPA